MNITWHGSVASTKFNIAINIYFKRLISACNFIERFTVPSRECEQLKHLYKQTTQIICIYCSLAKERRVQTRSRMIEMSTQEVPENNIQN